MTAKSNSAGVPKETRHYSGLLYALADTLTDAAQAEEVREAASRLDLQTVGINEFRRQKDLFEEQRDHWIDAYAKLKRESEARIAELELELEACRSDLKASTEACEELDGDLRAANQVWQPIETVPKDRRILGELIKALDSARKDMIRLSFECDTGYEPSQRMIDEIISKSESESPVGKITAAMVAAQKQEGGGE